MDLVLTLAQVLRNLADIQRDKHQAIALLTHCACMTLTRIHTDCILQDKYTYLAMDDMLRAANTLISELKFDTARSSRPTTVTYVSNHHVKTTSVARAVQRGIAQPIKRTFDIKLNQLGSVLLLAARHDVSGDKVAERRQRHWEGK